MYSARIKVHPEKPYWELYADDNGSIITSDSFQTLYNDVIAKYGKSEVVIMKDVKYVIYPVERVDI
jgi:hypothetical protein